MRVKWYRMKYTGRVENPNMYLFEKDYSEIFEGEVIATVPIPEWKKSTIVDCSYQFVVLLPDNTFTEVPISMCEKIDNI